MAHEGFIRGVFDCVVQIGLKSFELCGRWLEKKLQGLGYHARIGETYYPVSHLFKIQASWITWITLADCCLLSSGPWEIIVSLALVI